MSFVVATAAALQLVSGCDAHVEDIATAFSANDRPAAQALLDRTPETCAHDPRIVALEAQSAWFDADFETASVRAADAVEAWGEAQCAWTRDTARLAFIAGFSHFTTDTYGLDRYYLWVAKRIDAEVGGLSRGARSVAEHYSEYVGAGPGLDHLMLESPYLDPMRSAAAHCAQFPQIRLRSASAPQDRLVTVLELRANGAGRISRVVEHYSHPRPAGDALLASINGRMGYRDRITSWNVYHLDPCADRLTMFDREPVCLPGHEPENAAQENPDD